MTLTNEASISDLCFSPRHGVIIPPELRNEYTLTDFYWPKRPARARDIHFRRKRFGRIGRAKQRLGEEYYTYRRIMEEIALAEKELGERRNRIASWPGWQCKKWGSYVDRTDL